MSEILREWQEIYEKGEKKPGVVFIEKPGFAVYKHKSFISQFDDLAVEGDLENAAKNCPLTQIILNLNPNKFVVLRLTKKPWWFGERYLFSAVCDRSI